MSGDDERLWEEKSGEASKADHDDGEVTEA